MNTGKQIRLNRFWKHERTLIIPFDHGLHSGVEGSTPACTTQ
jgi:DhnA family fructose-bisphosphate aldolase class Ia